MIKVENLTKRYPARTAVDDISFHVARGEIVGFLGPNGAGKSTTMRILTGYLEMTGGQVEIGGTDVRLDPLTVRRKIGYLPESCPLYPELRVDEYLRFRAELRGVSRKKRKERLEYAKEMCGLTDVGSRIIGQLSKGYRQRVGLAETLLHDPELLILDEPTVGLDPNQMRQVRELIRSLAEKHTILLSTHILPEVEAVCERIIIIKDGRIAASDSTENLRRRISTGARVSVEAQCAPEKAGGIFGSLPGLLDCSTAALAGGWSRLEIKADSDEIRETIFSAAKTSDIPLRELHLQPESLEDIFVKITREGKRS